MFHLGLDLDETLFSCKKISLCVLYRALLMDRVHTKSDEILHHTQKGRQVVSPDLIN